MLRTIERLFIANINSGKTLHSNLFNQKRNLVKKAQSQPAVFDKSLRIKHLDISSKAKDAHIYDYIRDFAAKDVCDRVGDLKLDSKRLILNIGSCSGLVAKNLDPACVEALLQADVSEHSIRRSMHSNSTLPPKFPLDHVLCDQESISFRKNSLDLVISCLDLHWVNDLVKCFKRVNSVLRDDRAFIGALLGGDTLYEMRTALQLAELERLSGISSHVAPKTTGQDVGRLLQACGFKLITVDISEIKISYPSVFELMFDLQGMGENNASLLGSNHMHRDVLKASAAIYQKLYGDGENTQKGVPATFQIIHFIGWKNPVKATPLKSQ